MKGLQIVGTCYKHVCIILQKNQVKLTFPEEFIYYIPAKYILPSYRWRREGKDVA